MRNLLFKHYSLATVTSIIVLTLITIVAISYNYHRINLHYKKLISTDSALIINTINNTLAEYNDVITDAILKSKDESCQTLRPKLTQTVLANYKIRSLSILHNDTIFCSSYDNVDKLPKKITDQYTQYTLMFKYSTFLRPKTLIVSYNVQKDNWRGVITIPVTIFFNELTSTNLPKNTYIIFNDRWLNLSDYQLLDKKGTDTNWRLFKSDKFPFVVAFDYSAIKIDKQSLLSYYLIIIIGFSTSILLLLYIIFTRTKHNLQRAILKKEFIPYYQLIVSATHQTWIGVEVLTRWQHPKKELIMPNAFIPLAESTGLIIPLTKALMEKVASELPKHVEIFPKPLHIGFNIHPLHLKNQGLLDDCKKFLKAFPENSIHLILEITESQFIDSSTDLDSLLQEFRQIGITIAVDDFGTGYSNFGYLQKYSIDHLKIDKLFVSKSCTINADTHLLDIIISLAKKLRMTTVAEGVETTEQFHYLTRQGVEFIQGFLFNKPSPLKDMIELLSKPVKKIDAPSHH